ncbi:MAG: hypothetical protein RLZZ584_233 [Pseudomonadota bacterium]|jgi:tetratricopeptide (TPR) repeat protein
MSAQNAQNVWPVGTSMEDVSDCKLKLFIPPGERRWGVKNKESGISTIVMKVFPASDVTRVDVTAGPGGDVPGRSGPCATGVGLLAMLLALGACAATPPQAIGPLVAPPTRPVAPDCPVLMKNCERPPLTAAAADVADLARLVQAADDLLFSGDEQAAWAQLNQALKIDPRHHPALMLMSQITDDPHKLLGEPGETYTPQPGETLRQIAAARLGDARWFYALARYNQISVPRDLSPSRSLKVPRSGGGKALRVQAARTEPAPQAVPPPSLQPPAPVVTVPQVPSNLEAMPPTGAGPAGGDAESAMRRGQVAEKAGRVEQAYAYYMRALALGHAGAAERAGVMRQELIARYRRDARVALERQDLDRAIKAWRFVLELDPDDAAATAELRKLQRRKDAPKAP